MSLQPGTRLHQYEVLEAIGAGGMGEVYRARDGNLDRDVAIKVLPRGMADNPVNLARLEREARAIAALSHPNILSVFDLGTFQDTAYVVTELLEGQTLGERLQDGPLPPRKVTEVGRQIARGLAAAHDKGIVHRDLKPDNLFLTRDGRVKILDFGLASSGGARDPDADIRSEDTVANLTQPGTVLGTVNYMSPEQVRGKPADHRSDLFSLGTVLYEMVSGVRPFQRETPAETMTAILKEDPADLAVLTADVPPALAAIIRRCIEKGAGERFHSAHDLAFSLEALSGSSVSSGKVAAIDDAPAARRRPGWLAMVALVLAGLLVGAGGLFLFLPAPEGDDLDSLNFLKLSSRRGVVTNARFTGTDGAALYSASWDGGPMRLYPATPDARTSDPVGTVDAALLSISSTGQLALLLDQRHPVGWETVGTLAVSQPGGTAPRRVLENVHAADWGPDGQAMAVAREVDGAVQLEYPVGTVLYRSPGWISALRVHPDGSRILFTDCSVRGDNRALVKIVDRDGSLTELGTSWSWGLAWDPDGKSAWCGVGTAIFRVREGSEPQRIYRSLNNLHLMDIAPDGRILAASVTARRELIARAPGAAEEVNLSWLDWSTPTILSDDGKTAVFEEGNQMGQGGYGVYLRDLEGAAPLLLGFGSAVGLAPDGEQVAVLKRKFGPDPELVLTPTGVGTPTTLPLGGLRLLGAEGRWLRGPEAGDPDALVILGRMDEGPPQLFHVPLIAGGVARAITPADLPLAAQGHIVARDGGRVIVKPVQGSPVGFTLDGQGPQVLPGLKADDLPLGFDRDGIHCFVLESGRIPAPIVRVDLVSGERELWRELAPTDPAGVFQIDRVRISADGSAYVYSVRRVLTELMLIEGMR